MFFVSKIFKWKFLNVFVAFAVEVGDWRAAVVADWRDTFNTLLARRRNFPRQNITKVLFIIKIQIGSRSIQNLYIYRWKVIILRFLDLNMRLCFFAQNFLRNIFVFCDFFLNFLNFLLLAEKMFKIFCSFNLLGNSFAKVQIFGLKTFNLFIDIPGEGRKLHFSIISKCAIISQQKTRMEYFTRNLTQGHSAQNAFGISGMKTSGVVLRIHGLSGRGKPS